MGLFRQRAYRSLSWLLASFIWLPLAWAAPDQQMTVAPAASSGTTITAADENARNNSIATPYNAHTHADLSSTTANTFNLGDGAAGNKTFCFNAAQSTDTCLRWDDTNQRLVMNVGDTSTYSVIAWTSGTAGVAAGRLLQGNGTSALQSFNTAAPVDDQVLVADSASAGTFRTVPNCTDTSGQHLNYTQSTNAFSCGTSGTETGTWAVTANAKDTIYTNSGGRKRRVAITMEVASGNNTGRVQIENANPPTVNVLSPIGPQGAVGATTDWNIFFEVPAGQYYRLVTLSGTIAVAAWYEMDE